MADRDALGRRYARFQLSKYSGRRSRFDYCGPSSQNPGPEHRTGLELGMATDLDRSQARQKKKLLFEQNKNTKQQDMRRLAFAEHEEAQMLCLDEREAYS